jgi:AraC-like DNA-binding protein
MPEPRDRVFSNAVELLSFLVMGKERLGYDRKVGGYIAIHTWSGSPHRVHRHSELEFNLVLKGRGTYIIEGKRYELARDSMLWLFPAQNHILAAATDDFEMVVAVFSRKIVREHCRTGAARVLALQDPGQSFCRRIAAPLAMKLLERCRDIIGIGGDPERYSAGLAYTMLSAWDAYSSASDILASGILHASVERAARLLQEESGADDLPHIAAEVGLSPSRLSRLFARQMGVPLARFRNMRRLERFMRLHEKGAEANMLDLAYRAGFGSYAQFYRVFRDSMGFGPNELRRRSHASG